MDRRDVKLMDMRLEDEHVAQERENAYRASGFKEGRPPIPEAQLVMTGRRFGVAVQGSKFVVPLPAGYAGPGLALAVIDGDRLIATHPEKPALFIDPMRGEARPL